MYSINNRYSDIILAELFILSVGLSVTMLETSTSFLFILFSVSATILLMYLAAASSVKELTFYDEILTYAMPLKGLFFKIPYNAIRKVKVVHVYNAGPQLIIELGNLEAGIPRIQIDFDRKKDAEVINIFVKHGIHVSYS
ncbi:MAG: hypothetical protein JST49_00340 [Bacteroidetes bacterium]|nr:hypothetical protein [Bacteroidota bacterium]